MGGLNIIAGGRIIIGLKPGGGVIICGLKPAIGIPGIIPGLGIALGAPGFIPGGGWANGFCAIFPALNAAIINENKTQLVLKLFHGITNAK